MRSVDLPDARVQLVNEKEDSKDDIYVTINLNGMKRPVTVLVDTGADVSLLKEGNILNRNRIIKTGIRTIGGAFNGSSRTLGSFNACWRIKESVITTEWQVVNDLNNIPVDGILGRDILWNKSIIDTRKKTLSLLSSNGALIEKLPLIKSPIFEKNTNNSDKINITSVRTIDVMEKFQLIQDEQNIKYKRERQIVPFKTNQPDITRYTPVVKVGLEPRTINIIQVKIAEPEDTEIVVNSQELGPGILLGNCVSTVSQGYIKLAVTNCSSTPIMFENHEISYQYMANFENVPTNEEIGNVGCNIALLSLLDPEVQSRVDKVKERLQVGENLTEEEYESISSLCGKFHNLFHMDGDKLTYTTVLKHTIPVKTDQAPINQKMYRLPPVFKEEINKQVQQLLDNDIVIHSKSPWSSPLLLVPKKPGRDGQKRWRMVNDFRKLNQVTIKDAFPLPRIEDILDQLGKSEYFSTLDLASGYHQVLVDPRDRPKTAFSTPLGHFEYKRMPFGLSGAPATFQRIMNHILTGLQGIDCFVYLDDIVIYGASLNQHNKRLERVFRQLQKYNLKLQTDKCKFLCREVTYLGHHCSKEGALPDKTKVECVKNYPIPRNTKETMALLGLANYYRKFIQNYADIVKPVSTLLKKGVKFEWSPACEGAIQKVKDELVSPNVLIYPDFTKPFTLTTDASNVALGAILSQGPEGEDRPIAFASRSLQAAERNYSTTEKELLAIVWGVKHFRPYLLSKEFTVFTDHKPLQGIMKSQDPTSRILRFLHKLSEYQFQVVYKAGKKNTNADALSRIPYEVTAVDTPESTVTPTTQEKDKKGNEQAVLAREQNCFVIRVIMKTIQEYLYGNINTRKICIIWCVRSDARSSVTWIDHSKFVEKMLRRMGYVVGLGLGRHAQGRLEPISIMDDGNIRVHGDRRGLGFVGVAENEWQQHISTTFESECSSQSGMQYEEQMPHVCVVQTRAQREQEALQIQQEEDDVTTVQDVENVTNTIENNDNELNNIDHTLFDPPNVRALTEEKEIKEVLKMFHDTPLGGHQGVKRTIKRIQEQYKWQNMAKDIEAYIKKCKNCQKFKQVTPTRMPMVITDTATQPFEKVFLDIVGPLQVTSKGNKYILTFLDDLTKYFDCYALPDAEAATVARTFYNEIISRYRIPDKLVTDQGTNFTSDLFSRICKLLNIQKLQTSAYRPQSNGALERCHKDLGAYLRNILQDHGQEWDDWLRQAAHVHNSYIHAATKLTPFECLFGFKSKLPNNLKGKVEPIYNADDYYFELRYTLQKMHEYARENLIIAKNKSKEYYDQYTKVTRTLTNKDKVYVKNEARKGKLDEIWSEPFNVVKSDGVNTTIRKDRKEVVVHNNRIKLCNT